MIGFHRLVRYVRRTREAGVLTALLIMIHRVRAYLLYPEFCAKRYGLVPARMTGHLFSHVIWRRDEIERFARHLAEPRYRAVAAAAVERAERAERREFRFLGWGPITLGERWPWQSDFYHGYEWPDRFYKAVDYVAPGRRCDVKVAWELNRLQFLVWFGQAWLVDDDPKWPKRFLEVLTDWRTQNPCGYGVNWTCAMEVAIRAINIVAAYELLAGGLPESSIAQTRQLLDEHYYFLSHNLEYSDVPGNHYFFDVLGLAVLSMSLKGPAERQTRADVRRMLSVIDAQFQPDGTHLENATGYHRLVTEGLVLFIRACRRQGIELPTTTFEVLSAATQFLENIATQAGDIPLLGDSDSGRVLILTDVASNNVRPLLAAANEAAGDVPVELPADEAAFWLPGPTQPERRQAERIATSLALTSYPHAGVYVFHLASIKLIIRCGRGGLKGRGSHDHNDQLSCVLYLGNEAVLLDPGTSNYTFDIPEHARDISTAQHNCVKVGEVEQSPIIRGSVTCTVRSATATCEAITADGQQGRFQGVLSRYGSASGTTVRRTVTIARDGDCAEVAIDDEVIREDETNVASVASYHFGPSWDVAGAADGIRARSGPRTVELRFEFASGPPLIEAGTHAADYGSRDRHTVVRQSFGGRARCSKLRAVMRIPADDGSAPC